MWIEQNVESLHVSAFRNVLFQQLPTKLVLRNSLLCSSSTRRPSGSVQLRRCEHVVDAHPQHHN